MGIPLVAGMAIAGAASSMMQAQQQNAQARGMANNALGQSKKRQGQLLERDEVMSGRIKKKSDQERLAIARKTAQEAGARIVASAGRGVTSDSGSDARAVADAMLRGTQNQQTAGQNYVTAIDDLRSKTEAGIFEDQARLENVLNQAQGMTQNVMLAGIMGGATGAMAGGGVNTGLGIEV